MMHHTPRATPSIQFCVCVCVLFSFLCVSLIVTVTFGRSFFVSYGTWGEKKIESAGNDGKVKELEERLLPLPIACPPALSIF